MDDDLGRMDLSQLFRRGSTLLVQELTARLNALGHETQPAASALVLDNLDPDGTSVGTLAARADVSHQYIGQLVGGLEAEGWVRRIKDPKDARSSLILLTTRGKEFVKTGRREFRTIEKLWLQELECADRDTRTNLTTAIRASRARLGPPRNTRSPAADRRSTERPDQ